MLLDDRLGDGSPPPGRGAAVTKTVV